MTNECYRGLVFGRLPEAVSRQRLTVNLRQINTLGLCVCESDLLASDRSAGSLSECFALTVDIILGPWIPQ